MSATETVRVGNSGVIPIPIGLQHLAGIHAGSEVLIEAAGGTLVIRSKKDRPDAAASERATTSRGPLPRWLEDAVATLNRLASLEANWDSYGAKPIDGAAIRAAAELLLRVAGPDTPAPAIVPTSQGAILLEWHTRGIDLEIEVKDSEHQQGTYEDASQNQAWEADILASSSQLTEAMSRLSTA